MALILVVNDEPDAGRLLERIFSARGHQVHGCPEPQTALGWLAEHRPDLAVLDLKIQAEDVSRLVQAMRGLRPELKVVVITSYFSRHTGDWVGQPGILDCLVKPLELEELEKRVERALASAGAR